MSPRKQSPLTIEYVLLGLLDSQSMHGYDLYKALNRLDGVRLVWRIKQSQLYALLERLDADGMVEGTIVPGENRPDRCEYSLTADGRLRFETWRSSPVAHMRDVRQEFLARLYFALAKGKETARNLISDQRAVCREWISDMTAQVSGADSSRLFDDMVYRYRISQASAMLEWLDQCERML